MIFQTREEVIAMTPLWKGERFEDGRPKVADRYLDALYGMTLEELWKPIFVQGYENQFLSIQPLHPEFHEDGTVNRTTYANTQAMIMPRDGYDSDVVWQYVRWYCGADSQTRQAREAIAVSQPTSKFSTANITALLSQKWTTQEREAIRAQINNLVGIPEYPGAYIVPTYVQFAFLNAYNLGMDPSEAMLDEVTDINKEISRKRKEFGLEAYEISYGSRDESEETGSGN